MPHQGNSPADIIGYNGQGKPIYKGHRNGNRNGGGVRRNGNSNGNRNTRMRNGRAATPQMRRNMNMNNRTAANTNPVTREFTAPQSPRYYKPNGQIVPVGAPLHQHQDGTIMTEHLRGGSMPDTSVIVSPSRTTRSQNRRRTTRTNMMRNRPARRTTANRVNRRPRRRTGGTSY